MSAFDNAKAGLGAILAARGKDINDYVVKIRPQIRNTSRGELPPHGTVPVRALVDFVNNEYRDKNCRGGGKHFKAGSTVYLRREVNGFLSIMPFELAGQGFEMCKDAVEGKHYEFI